MSVYSPLASLYDQVMSHVPYGNWVDLIEEIALNYFRKTPSIFEIGGGTGTVGSILTYQEYPYLGSDQSEDMCNIAWSKGLDFICADCRSIPISKKFDLVIFLFDGINYLRSKEDYHKTFEEVYKILKPGGYFLFDITTENNSQTFFDDYTEADSFEEGSYIRHSWYDPSMREQHNDFDIYLKNDNNEFYTRYREEHCQIVFPVNEVRSFIPDSLFTVEEEWGDFKKEYNPLSVERVLFLLGKCDYD